MHGNYREPINKKYLIIAVIGVVIFAVLLSFFTLKTPNKTASNTKQQADQSKPEYAAIKKSLDQKFNSNGRIVTIKEERNINDSTSQKAHTVIVVSLTDKQTQKYLKTTYEAVQNNTANDDQKLYIHSIQKIISDEAKKLDNRNDVIQFVYKDGGKYIPIASSQKNKFIIKPVEINQSSKKAAA